MRGIEGGGRRKGRGIRNAIMRFDQISVLSIKIFDEIISMR